MTRFNTWKMACVLLLLCLVMTSVSPAATTFKTLLNFDGTNGSAPSAALVQGLDGNLYGVTSSGGKNGDGTFFKITTEGKLTTLYNFCSKANCADGEFPAAALLLATNGNFYGTTKYGGFKNCPVTTGGCGTVFEITPEGKLTTLYTFCVKGGENCTDGANPQAPLIQGTNGDFFGTTYFGGNSNGAGTLFEITPAGKLTTLYTFCSKAGENCPDGANPNGVIQGTDGNLYGTTFDGGGVSSSGEIPDISNNCGGTAYKTPAPPDKTIDDVIEEFCKAMQGELPRSTLFDSLPDPFDKSTGVEHLASDEADADVITSFSETSDDSTLTFYGTASGGGTHASGVVFSITSAKKYSDIYDFCAKKNCADGAYPGAPVIEGTDGNLYGTTTGGNGNSHCPSLNGCGTAFALTTKGVLTTLHSFDSTDGDDPSGGLVQATNGTFYGTTFFGGTDGDGTFFSISVGLGPFVETVPTVGAVGSSVIILGTDLTEASAVSFNGTAAKFKVVSPTEITTTVPSGATTGTVEVTTPSGTLKSWPFQVP